MATCRPRHRPASARRRIGRDDRPTHPRPVRRTRRRARRDAAAGGARSSAAGQAPPPRPPRGRRGGRPGGCARINEAWAILSNPARRAEYDAVPPVVGSAVERPLGRIPLDRFSPPRRHRRAPGQRGGPRRPRRGPRRAPFVSPARFRSRERAGRRGRRRHRRRFRDSGWAAVLAAARDPGAAVGRRRGGSPQLLSPHAGRMVRIHME